MFLVLTVFNDWALLGLRLVVAAIFLAHGLPKIKDLNQTAANFNMMGFKPGHFWGTVVALAETFGGLTVLLGIGTQVAALLLAFDMFVAFLWKVKRGQGLVGGFELDLLLFASLLVLATMGGGSLALIF